MPAIEPRFALNHIIAPRRGSGGLLRARGRARDRGGRDPQRPRRQCHPRRHAGRGGSARWPRRPACGSCRSTRCSGSTTGGAERANEALALADYAAACGAEALVLVPSNDGTPPDRLHAGARGAGADPGARAAGRAGRAAGLCDLRGAAEVGGGGGDRRVMASDVFRITHDTFHHHLAGEEALFPDADRARAYLRRRRSRRCASAEMRDAHRVLVDRGGPAGQCRADPRALRGGLRRLPVVRAVRRGGADLADPAEAIRREHGAGAGGDERRRGPERCRLTAAAEWNKYSAGAKIGAEVPFLRRRANNDRA